MNPLKCDICSKPGAKTVSIKEMKEIARNGFGPRKLGIATTLDGGVELGVFSSEQADELWRQHVLADTTSWIICAKCYEKTRPFVTHIPHLERDVFLDREKTLSAAMILLKILFPEPPKSDTENIVYYYAESQIRENVEAIFTSSESPIETIFLNALHLYSISENPFLFMFVPCVTSANEQVYGYRSFYERSMQMWKDFQRLSGEEAIEEFLTFVQNKADVSAETKSMIERFVILDLLDRHNSYFLSLQAKFEGFKIQGKTIRPDLFIWIASKPEFGLIVECDGYAYHSNKVASSNDKERDRLLQSYGFQVFRFSGHEIVHKPIEAAGELYQYLVAEKKD